MTGKNARDVDASDERSAKRIKLEEDSSAAVRSLTKKPTLTKTGKVRRSTRTPQERCMELLQDPRIGAAQPHQVFCRMCGNWVKLFNHTEYVSANWLAHAKRCEAKTNWTAQVKAEPDTIFDIPAVSPVPVEQMQPSHLQEIVIPPAPEPAFIKEEEVEIKTKFTVKSLERRLLAIKDTRVDQAEPHRILCKNCSTWVKLHPAREYDLWNWHKHIAACEKKPRTTYDSQLPNTSTQSGPTIPLQASDSRVSLYTTAAQSTVQVIPSSEVDTTTRKRKSRSVAERIQAFEADPHCGEFTPNEAFCLSCKRWIRLHKDVPYVDSNWHRHLKTCGAQASGSGSSQTRKKPIKTEIENVIKLEPAQGDLTLSSKASRSQDARMQELLLDPRIMEVESYRVQCKLCTKWIKLQPQRKYDSWNWRKHISSCQQRKAVVKLEKTDDIIDLTGYSLTVSKSMDQASASKPVTSSQRLATIHANAWRIYDTASEDERRRHLLADTRCRDVEPHRLTCTICSRSIGLHAKKPYSLSNWYKHVNSCENFLNVTAKVEGQSALDEQVYPDFESSSTLVDEANQSNNDGSKSLSKIRLVYDDPPPTYEMATQSIILPTIKSSGGRKVILRNSQRIAESQSQQSDIVLLDGPPPLTQRQKRSKEKAEEREARLRQDDRLLKVEAEKVLCKMCNKWIRLQHRLPYDPSNWLTHAKKCQVKHGWGDSGTALGGYTTLARIKAEPETIDLTAPEDILAKMEEQLQQPLRDDFGNILQPMKVLTICNTCHKLITQSEEPRHSAQCQRSAISSPEKSTKADVRNEAELRADPRLAAVERGRVLCRLCSSWIKLQQSHSFLPGNWHRHISKCEKRSSSTIKIIEPQPKFDPESEEEDEPDAESAKRTGALGAVELAEIIDGYLPCFSSMDIQTRSLFKPIPPPPKRITPKKQPTRRSPRKLPNAGCYIPEGMQEGGDSASVKIEAKEVIDLTGKSASEDIIMSENKPYNYKNVLQESAKPLVSIAFKPVDWSRKDEEEDEEEEEEEDKDNDKDIISRPESSTSSRSTSVTEVARPQLLKRNWSKKMVPTLGSPFTRTVLNWDFTPRMSMPTPIPYLASALTNTPYTIGKFSAPFVPVNLAYGPMALGARVMRA